MFCKVDVRWIYVLEGTKRQRRQRGGSLSGEDAGCVLVRGPFAAAHPLPGECPRPLTRVGKGGARRVGSLVWWRTSKLTATTGALQPALPRPSGVGLGPGRGGAVVGRQLSVGRGGGRPIASPPRGRGAPPGESRVMGSRAGSPGACGENRSAAAGAPAQTVGWRQLFALCSLLAMGVPRERTNPPPRMPLRAARYRCAGTR